MLKKLRIKFIIINMSIVTLILFFIFSLIYFSSNKNMERGSIDMLERIARNPMHSLPPKIHKEEIILPYYSILVDDDGNITDIGSESFSKIDSEKIHNYVRSIQESNLKQGIIKDSNLRYICVDDPKGKCYVFADIASEKSMQTNLLKNLIIIGLSTFFIFLLISNFLSQWAVKPVEKTWLQQKQFIADASHELKTPLTVIMTDAELIHNTQCSDTEQNELSSNIITMSKQMRGLVEKMLELARIDGTTSKIQKQIISLSDTVSNSAMMFEPLFFEKGLTLSYEINPNIKTLGNTEQINQLVEILLDNARKYSTDKGLVKLKLENTQHKKCILSISNESQTLSKDEIDNLFKRFYRVDKSRKMSHSYGLGLSIAKEIVKRHNGRIWAKSNDSLITFFVELPTSHTNKTYTHPLKIIKKILHK